MLSSVLDSVRRAIPPIHPDGYKFIAAFAVVTLLLGWLWGPLFWIFLALTLWCAYFFRDPLRVTPVDARFVVAPADGIVSFVGAAVPPAELGLGPSPRLRVSIFLSVFDCHINRAPASGRLTRVAYKAGKFINAELDKASEDNERNGLVIETANGEEIGVVQIAGLVARRILCFVREGETVMVGERFGLIRFGSRLDVYLPAGSVARVAEGQRAVGGETVVGDLSGEAASPIIRVS